MSSDVEEERGDPIYRVLYGLDVVNLWSVCFTGTA